MLLNELWLLASGLIVIAGVASLLVTLARWAFN